VERALPGTLHVRIIEREPVALWQYQGKVALVDDNGVVMDGIDKANYRSLPLIVGAGAPQRVGEVLALLVQQPGLAQRFAAAVRVGERRWNIRLDNGMEIRLPEANPGNAWQALAEIDREQKLLARDIRVIDLRVGGRLFIKLSPEGMPAATPAGAKET
jgi:cell division protein FtsQ